MQAKKERTDCLYAKAISAKSFLLVRYTSSLNPGWSASNSAPYINTRLEDLSSSEMCLGNHGIPSSVSNDQEHRPRSMFNLILVYSVLNAVYN